MKQILPVILLACFICCQSPNRKDVNGNIIHKISEEPVDSSEVYINLWISDTCGCNKVRTIEMAMKIIDDFELMGKPIDSVVKYLGKDFDGCLGYDAGSLCEEGIPNEYARTTGMLFIEKGRVLYNGFPFTIKR